MIDFKQMVENESVEDVLLYLAPLRAYRDIDHMYVRYNFDVAADRLLLTCFQKLLNEEKLAKNSRGHAIKGPNWKAPAFVTERKYGIE